MAGRHFHQGGGGDVITDFGKPARVPGKLLERGEIALHKEAALMPPMAKSSAATFMPASSPYRADPLRGNAIVHFGPRPHDFQFNCVWVG